MRAKKEHHLSIKRGSQTKQNLALFQNHNTDADANLWLNEIIH
jgi:hypothetical protein